MKKGGFLARSTLPRPGGQSEAGQRRARPEIEKAIGELRARIALLEKEFPDVITAYNLDGGSSSTLVFRKGSEKWAKINCPKSGKKRGLRDIIYFASAWKPSK